MSKKILDKNFEILRIQDSQSQLNRARSLTVGTAFGGTVEVNMRANDGSNLWCILQPVEAIEFIHQLAGLVGCHIHLQPREDFSSWRNWRVPDGSNRIPAFNWPPFSNHPPHTDEEAKQHLKAHVLPPPKQQPGLKIENKENESVTVKKNVKQRKIKHSTTSN